ncbi:hypothetical protein GCM10017044_01480 [Kordiimonas sediminis]|uniref:Uncharacterized protein n=1 Tax=Kordiimonas sediminis TaxID=1735581 RepID=A0A919AIW4_9PROT|nr:DUF6134 family protein [Kordiimonas sediminis]GHF11425.1 hypothetical protein GCM10017044_01480 [Kordiimonas sediminis]
MLALLASTCILTASTAPTPKQITNDWALETYGPKMEFQVHRDGKKIGSHQVTFSETEQGHLQVEAETRLRVKFLFLTAYKFDYKTKSIWQDSTLKRLDARTRDGGDVTEFSANFDMSSVTIQMDDKQKTHDIQSPLFPTNHWNPSVLDRTSVFNTITGRVNDIEIIPRDWETIDTPNGPIKARRYDYAGDLQDVSSWYDEKGRWVGLRFKGRDGSTISYECVQCGVSG